MGLDEKFRELSIDAKGLIDEIKIPGSDICECKRKRADLQMRFEKLKDDFDKQKKILHGFNDTFPQDEKDKINSIRSSINQKINETEKFLKEADEILEGKRIKQ